LLSAKSFKHFSRIMPPEFTVTLNDDKTVSIIIDGEQLYCNLTADDLKEFVQDFIDSNTEN